MALRDWGSPMQPVIPKLLLRNPCGCNALTLQERNFGTAPPCFPPERSSHKGQNEDAGRIDRAFLSDFFRPEAAAGRITIELPAINAPSHADRNTPWLSRLFRRRFPK